MPWPATGHPDVGCCGSKRAAASAALGRAGRGSAAASAVPGRVVSSAKGRSPESIAPRPPLPAAARLAEVSVTYLGSQPVRVRGTPTGRVYRASPARALISIDARDVAALLRTGLFRASSRAA